MREIVKRETIETSIAGGCSACASRSQACAERVLAVTSLASQHQFGLAEKGQRKVTRFGSFYRLWLGRWSWTEASSCVLAS